MDSAEGCTEVLVGAAAIREHLQQLNRNVRAREHMRNDEKVGVEGGGGGGDCGCLARFGGRGLGWWVFGSQRQLGLASSSGWVGVTVDNIQVDCPVKLALRRSRAGG
jgi:hypothetical protein